MRRRFFSAEQEYEYMTLEPLVDGIYLNVTAIGSGVPKELYYSIDNGDWQRVRSRYDFPTCSFNVGQSIRFKALSYDSRLLFDMSGAYKVSGSVMSLDNNRTEILNDFSQLFYNSTNLISVSKTFLPATTLANSCYSYMFNGCTSLTTAPELPATTLANDCYNGMFDGCTSLTTAPELPATTLANYCYQRMFYGCTNLNYIKMLATDISASDCLYNWVSGVASSGTFVKNAAMTSLPTEVHGIPSGWTVIDDTFPTNEYGYPDSIEFSFPLYLNCTHLDYEDDAMLSYSRPADEISDALMNFLAPKVPQYGDEYVFSESEKIFVNRIPITNVYRDAPNILCDGDANITFAIEPYGEIWIDYYK